MSLLVTESLFTTTMWYFPWFIDSYVDQTHADITGIPSLIEKLKAYYEVFKQILLRIIYSTLR